MMCKLLLPPSANSTDSRTEHWKKGEKGTVPELSPQNPEQSSFQSER